MVTRDIKFNTSLT